MAMENETIDLITKAILGGIITAGFTFTAFLLKALAKSTKEHWTEMFDSVMISINKLVEHQKEMNGSVKDIILKEQACRESLPKEYVTIQRFAERKADTSKMFKDLFEIAADIREKLSFLLGTLSPDAIIRGNIEAEKKQSISEVK